MGNIGDSEQTSENIQQLSICHPNFLYAIRRTSPNKDIIEIQLSMPNQRCYQQWVKQLSLSPKTPSESILYPLKHCYRSEGICSSAGLICAEYPNYSMILKSLIEDRKTFQHRKFKESQLWYLLYTIAEVGYLSHYQMKKIGDVRSLNIFLNSEETIKIATIDSFPKEINNFQKARVNPGEKVYLAPEELDQLQQGYCQNKSLYKEADSFSTGLVLLDAALLENSEKLYRKSANRRRKYLDFDYQLLDGWKENLKNQNGYGNVLKYVILSFLELSPANRISLSDTFLWLENHSQKILNFSHFSFGFLPKKLEKTSEKYRLQFSQQKYIENSNFLVEAEKYPHIKKAESTQIEEWPKFSSSSNKETLNKLHEVSFEEQEDKQTKKTKNIHKNYLPSEVKNKICAQTVYYDDDSQKKLKNDFDTSYQSAKFYSQLPPISNCEQRINFLEKIKQKNEQPKIKDEKKKRRQKYETRIVQKYTERYFKKAPKYSSKFLSKQKHSPFRDNENVDRTNCSPIRPLNEKPNEQKYSRENLISVDTQTDALISSIHKEQKKPEKVLLVESVNPQKSAEPIRRIVSPKVSKRSSERSRLQEKELLQQHRLEAEKSDKSIMQRIQYKIAESKKLFPTPEKLSP